MSSDARKPRILVCNCQKTMDIDGVKLAAALGRAEDFTVASELCRGQIAMFERALGTEAPLLVACTQEAPLFSEIAEGRAGEGKPGAQLRFTNIRERAGWCEERGNVMPKMAALLAEAAFTAKPANVMTLRSGGQCLVYGAGQQALDVAQQLSSRLPVTVLLTNAEGAVPPSTARVALYKGRIAKATGHLGAFQIEVNGYAPALPSSRGALQFALSRDGAKSSCDLILDLSGGTALFGTHRKRDGYLKADPNHPAAVAKALFEISDLVGEFEKPLYVDYDAAICAHARSGKAGCRNCLDHCPTGAISPNGDGVAIDPALCEGCGNCSAVCPTGAVSYAYPQRQDLIARVQILLQTYLAAGGKNPVLLFHDETHGAALIGAMARFGRGLPANVLPVPMYAVTGLGHEVMLAALASGASALTALVGPELSEELPALAAQTGLATTLFDGLGFAGPRIEIITEADPDAVETRLWGHKPLPPMQPQPFAAVGGKREIARLALATLWANAPAPTNLIPLTAGAPYGRIAVKTAGCTLCLACVGACPVNALHDNLEKPQLSFTEAACVQCGLCVATCPENVITLDPRYNFETAALSPIVIKTEAPFHCISCGTPFGAKSSIERVLATLAGKHAMFQTSKQADLIRMCGNCRAIAVSQPGQDPFAGKERPRTLTTQDYIDAEIAAKASGRTPEDFLN